MTAPSRQDEPAGCPGELAPGLARERTSLSWTRTAIAFAALGGTALKVNVITGLTILALAPLIWQIGRVTRGAAAPGPARLFAISLAIVAAALLCLAVAFLGKSAPGALR